MPVIIKKKKKDTKKIVKSVLFWVWTSILYVVGLVVIILLLAVPFARIPQIDPDKPDQLYNGAQALGYYFGPVAVRGVLISLAAIVLVLMVSSIARLLRKIKIPAKKPATVFSIIVSIVKWGIILFAMFIVLWAWGFQPETILASMGILALIIGLGCQSLISDIVAGIFLVADDAFEVGDIVVIDDFRGTITEIGLKTTKLEDAGGNIKVISNSRISSMVNLTNALSLAIVEISIPYEENLKRTETLLLQHLKKMRKDIPAIVEGPYYKGVEDMADSAVILKVIAKVKEEDRFQATRDMKRNIYMFLNDNEITVPYPQLTITQGPNPADHPEWIDKDKEEKKAEKEAQKQQEESKDMEHVNDVQ